MSACSECECTAGPDSGGSVEVATPKAIAPAITSAVDSAMAKRVLFLRGRCTVTVLWQRYDELGPVRHCCPFARADVHSVARGLGEAEVVGAIAGHEWRDVELHPGVRGDRTLVVGRSARPRRPVVPVDSRLGPGAPGRVNRRTVG